MSHLQTEGVYVRECHDNKCLQIDACLCLRGTQTHRTFTRINSTRLTQKNKTKTPVKAVFNCSYYYNYYSNSRCSYVNDFKTEPCIISVPRIQLDFTGMTVLFCRGSATSGTITTHIYYIRIVNPF